LTTIWKQNNKLERQAYSVVLFPNKQVYKMTKKEKQPWDE
jgi:hypothetical protein